MEDPRIAEFRILVVDDSDFARNQIVRILNSWGFEQVFEASNAVEAMQVVGSRKIHLAVIDIVMPETSGLELAQSITDNYSDLAVVMLSSLAQERMVIESISVGAQDFLQKPVDELVFRDVVSKILDATEM